MTSLLVCSWNANGIRGRIAELIEMINRRKIDIMMINKTKMNSTDKLKIKGFTCIRKDRQNRAGGVAILVRKIIPFQEVKINYDISIEYVCIKLENNVHLISVYNKPLNNFATRDLEILLGVSDKVMIIGDLNARHANWNCHVNNKNGNTLNTYVQKNDVTVLYPSEPTHIPINGGTPTTIDIIVNKHVSNHYGIYVTRT